MDPESSWDPTILARALQYNGIHHRRHELPVGTLLVVLRREADHPTLTGAYCVIVPGTSRAHTLEYTVLRVWTFDVEQVLRGSLATLPLARERVERETDLAKIEEWLQRVAEIESWSELTR